jgi:ligand-binding SRPBCC domain-containing protein
MMKTHTLQRRQFIKKALSEVFAFFSEPGNLALLTPRKLGFKILTPLPIQMKNGALIDYTIKLLGINVRWTTFVTHFEPPQRFVDVQLRGPYSFWHHTHEFTETQGGTEMTDTVTYALPLGIIGTVMHELIVKRQLDAIFNYRKGAVEAVFSQERAGASHPQKARRRSKKS